MRRSSLGRRSSTNIPTRIPSLGASGQRRCSAEKRSGSLLRQPGYSQSKRSQSEDRESFGGRAMSSTFARSNTVGTLPGRNLGTMTPVTPSQNFHANLPTGSARPPRSQTMSTDSNRRMSSFGGTKGTRKDSRPISEKPFQQMAQAKVQQYFELYAPQLLNQGNSIRPMNTKLFVDLMDHLLKNFDSRIVITKSNYLEDLPTLLKKFGYRSKIDRSWLMTVNTPHSWQHVVAVLSWLVDLVECMDSVDEFEMMYGNNLADPAEEEEEDGEGNLKIDKDVVVHLKRTYRYQNEQNVEEMDNEFIAKLIIDMKCTDEDLEVLQREIDLVKEEVDGEEQRRSQQLEILETLKEKRNAFLSDFQTVQTFIEESKVFIESSEQKLILLKENIAGKRIELAKRQEELQKVIEKLSSQQISVNDIDKFTHEKQELNRMNQFYEKEIREYENSAYAVDLKLAENQRKLENLILDYNKLVAEKVIVEPRLKDVEVKFTLQNKGDKELMEVVNKNLKKLKEEYKNSIRSLETQKEEADSVLWRLKQDIGETEEEIVKETALLEGVECDLEKQEELINKESSKLKEEAHRYQKMTSEIMEEISQFDQAKLEEKKIELKKLEHDWELLQERITLYTNGRRLINQEAASILKSSLDKRNKKFIEFQKKHFEEH